MHGELLRRGDLLEEVIGAAVIVADKRSEGFTCQGTRGVVPEGLALGWLNQMD